MPSSSLIKVIQDDDWTLRLILNRPEKKNALNLSLLQELSHILETLDELRKKRPFRLLVLEGEGGFFSSGLDLSESENEEVIQTSGKLLAKIFESLAHLPEVTLSLIQGGALGGGAGLALAADLCLMEEGAFLGFPEVRRGLIAALVLTVLTRLTKERSVKRLLLTGIPVTASQAEAMGLITESIHKERFQERVAFFCREIIKGGPLALAKTKEAIYRLNHVEVKADLQEALTLHEEVRHLPEAKEGARAFMEKRRPYWDV